MPTHFLGGVTNVPTTNPLGQYVDTDPTKWHSWFTDWDTLEGLDPAVADSNDWEITVTEAGAGDAAISIEDADGGILKILNDGADNDAVFVQKKGESFLMEANKKAIFKTRFKLSDATDSDFVIGLQVTDTTPLDATDGIYFIKADDAATLSVVCRKNASTGSTSATVGTLTSDTFVSVAWYWDGVSSVKYFLNDVHVGTLTGVYASGASVYLPDTELTISFGVVNGAAAAKSAHIDYIFVAKER